MFEIKFCKEFFVMLLAAAGTAASGGVFIEELDAASDEKRGAMCAPLLKKVNGIFEIPLRRKTDSLGVEERRRLANNLFQLSYRTIGLENFGERSAPDTMIRAWNTTADDADLDKPETMHRVMSDCVAIYERLRKSGHITKADEEISLKLAKKEVSAILNSR